MQVISDHKLQVADANLVLGHYFLPDVVSTSDYYPYGMEVAARSFSAGGYRYGFQGQETDDEFLGGAVSYKYRVHDARIGRFLSRDPLAPEYPWNSPYAFSENRVIDAVELEGLEYIHYFLYLKLQSKGYSLIQKVAVEDFRGMSHKQIHEIHGKQLYRVNGYTTNDFYKRYSESFGKEGRGIKYSYFILDERTGRFNSGGTTFEESGNSISHGIYYGAGGPSQLGNLNFDPPGSETNEFVYDLPAIDEIDQLARAHDKAYEDAGAEDWHSDVRGLDADIAFIAGLKAYLVRASDSGYKDKVTERTPSAEAIKKAKNAITGFTVISNRKAQKKKKELERRREKESQE